MKYVRLKEPYLGYKSWYRQTDDGHIQYLDTNKETWCGAVDYHEIRLFNDIQGNIVYEEVAEKLFHKYMLAKKLSR